VRIGGRKCTLESFSGFRGESFDFFAVLDLFFFFAAATSEKR
jgi:hypothetical protein